MRPKPGTNNLLNLEKNIVKWDQIKALNESLKFTTFIGFRA